MNKEYFSHDYNARSDPKLTRVLMKMGAEGVGIYWCIIEMLYEQNGYISLSHIETIAFELHQQCERITSVLKDFDLFKFEDDLFYSESVLKRLELRANKSEKTRSAALKRWGNDANAKHLQCKSNAIKGKEKKEKEIKVKEDKIPAFDEFKDYALSHNSKVDITALELKYKAWVANEWKDGNNKKISNWKSKLLNTLPYIKNGNDTRHTDRPIKRVNDLWR